MIGSITAACFRCLCGDSRYTDADLDPSFRAMLLIRMFGSDLDVPPKSRPSKFHMIAPGRSPTASGWYRVRRYHIGRNGMVATGNRDGTAVGRTIYAGICRQQDVERRIDTFLSWRSARAVLGTTVADRRDLVSYAGMHPDRVSPGRHLMTCHYLQATKPLRQWTSRDHLASRIPMASPGNDRRDGVAGVS